MNRMINFNESNLSITMKMEDLKALFFYWEDEWAKRVADAEKAKERQEWYSTSDTAKMFNKSVSTINRWKHTGYLTAKSIGGRDYYAKKDIQLLMGAA